MVGDGASIVYIQEVIVRPEHRRSSIGLLLLQTKLARYENIYHIVLMTDDTEKTIAFYAKMDLYPPPILAVPFIKIHA